MCRYVWVSLSRGGSVCFSSSYDSGEETLIVQTPFYPLQVLSLWLFSHLAYFTPVTFHMSNVIPCLSMLAYVHIAYVSVRYTQREEVRLHLFMLAAVQRVCTRVEYIHATSALYFGDANNNKLFASFPISTSQRMKCVYSIPIPCLDTVASVPPAETLSRIKHELYLRPAFQDGPGSVCETCLSLNQLCSH